MLKIVTNTFLKKKIKLRAMKEDFIFWKLRNLKFKEFTFLIKKKTCVVKNIASSPKFKPFYYSSEHKKVFKIRF